MTKKLKKLLVIPLLCISTVLTGGCVAVAIGAAAGGTVAYVRGELEVTYEHDLETVYQATLAAVDYLGLSLISDRGDRTGGDMIARTGNDRRVKISMEPVADSLTEVTIRVGTFGDQDFSMRIHEEIRRNL